MVPTSWLCCSPFADLKNSSDLTAGCKPQQTDETREMVKKRRERKRGWLRRKRADEENCQSLLSYTSHRCLYLLDTPFQQSTVHLAIPPAPPLCLAVLPTPHSSGCAATEGVTRISVLHWLCSELGLGFSLRSQNPWEKRDCLCCTPEPAPWGPLSLHLE